ncbi:hypothetical protein RHECNPAF_280071 [Rhizobium etli CNPAF512]|nr:hypothetical protein RHECNPAF_280071 [Rhizobium etli CNPAF512]
MNDFLTIAAFCRARPITNHESCRITIRPPNREQKSPMRVSCPFRLRMKMKETHHAWHDTSRYPHSALDRSLAQLGL